MQHILKGKFNLHIFLPYHFNKSIASDVSDLLILPCLFLVDALVFCIAAAAVGRALKSYQTVLATNETFVGRGRTHFTLSVVTVTVDPSFIVSSLDRDDVSDHKKNPQRHLKRRATICTLHSQPQQTYTTHSITAWQQRRPSPNTKHRQHQYYGGHYCRTYRHWATMSSKLVRP